MLQVGIEPFGSNRNASHNLSPTLRASATRTTRPPSKQFFRKVPPSWEKIRWNELRDKMEIARQCSVLKPAIAIYAAFIAIGGSPFRCFASFQPESIWRLKCRVLRTPTPPTHTETDKMKKTNEVWELTFLVELSHLIKERTNPQDARRLIKYRYTTRHQLASSRLSDAHSWYVRVRICWKIEVSASPTSYFLQATKSFPT